MFLCLKNKFTPTLDKEPQKTPQNRSPEELKNLFEIVCPETYDYRLLN